MTFISHNALIQLAIDMADSLSDRDRFDRLLTTVRSLIPCDAVALLAVSGDTLKPLAHKGLSADLDGRRFVTSEHPRFQQICCSDVPVIFPEDSRLPDPYDGLVQGQRGDLPVHSCMGIPLRADDHLIGVLTLDSLVPGMFDDIEPHTLELMAAMSAASLKTAIRLQQLEEDSYHSHSVISELTQEALYRDGGEIIGDSPVMQKLRQELKLVAPSDYTVLVEGETGTGKELVTRKLHEWSRRSEGPLVYINCAAIPENLVESELFGHVKGAFTGADKKREGKFSLADGGTLFLDEIGELPLTVQSKLLRALQSQEIQPVGQDNVRHVDVRVVAATNRSLKDEVAKGLFRADLYHRLSVYPVQVPPLRQREGDITVLAGYFAEQVRRRLGLAQLVLDEQAIEKLNLYHWPGNVRELEHVISRAALLAQSGSDSFRSVRLRADHRAVIRIKASHLMGLALTDEARLSDNGTLSAHLPEQITPLPVIQKSSDRLSLKAETEQFQKQLILNTLQDQNMNWAAAARYLDTDRANLVRLARRLGIKTEKKIRTQH